MLDRYLCYRKSAFVCYRGRRFAWAVRRPTVHSRTGIAEYGKHWIAQWSTLAYESHQYPASVPGSVRSVGVPVNL